MPDSNKRKTTPASVDAGQPVTVPLFAFAAAKSAISVLFVAAFAACYLAADLTLPDWSGIWRAALKAGLACTGAGVFLIGLSIKAPGKETEISELFVGHDSVVIFLSIRVLPFVTVFAAGILAVVVLLTIRPGMSAAGVVALCAITWLPSESYADRFLCGKIRR